MRQLTQKEPLSLPVHTVDAPADTEGNSEEKNGGKNDDVPVGFKAIIVVMVVLSSHRVSLGRDKQTDYNITINEIRYEISYRTNETREYSSRMHTTRFHSSGGVCPNPSRCRSSLGSDPPWTQTFQEEDPPPDAGHVTCDACWEAYSPSMNRPDRQV